MQIIKKNKPNILPKIAFSILNSQSSKESIFNFMESAPAGATIPSKSCSISTIFINKLLKFKNIASTITSFIKDWILLSKVMLCLMSDVSLKKLIKKKIFTKEAPRICIN